MRKESICGRCKYGAVSNQYDPYPRDGRGPAGQLRPSRYAHGARTRGLLPWQHVLRFDPDHPIWPNRDRFVLSVGHASTLLYALLHLTGVKAVNPKYEVLGELSVSLDDLKRFRQLDS